VNGVAEASAIAGFPLDYGTLPVFIGTSGQPDPYNGKLAGIIDEPSIYNRALTPNEISAIYAAGSAGKCTSSTPASPVIYSQPGDQAATTNSTAIFAVIAGGIQPLNYQWYSNSVPLSDNGRFIGSDMATLTISNVQPTDAADYALVITNAYGSITSSVARLFFVAVPPSLTLQPQSQTALVGTNITFTAAVSGDAPLNYQWYLNGNPLTDDDRISGSDSTNLSLSNIQVSDAGNYTFTAGNLIGSVTSTNAVLTVLVPVTITTQPVGRSVPPGLPTTFNAAVSGTPTSLQWQLNGTNIPGAMDASYTITAVGTNDLGLYHLVASNNLNVAVSADAQLTFGPVAAWGRNTSNESLPPPGLSHVTEVAGTLGASFAVRTDGTIAAWGSGIATNIPATATNVVAVASATGNYALRSDGTVISLVGPGDPPLGVPPLTNIIAIAAGNQSQRAPSSGFALRAEGTLASWGSVPFPGFPAGLNHLTAISSGFDTAMALRNDGTVFVAGTGAITNIPAGLNNVVAIADGYTYAMALQADGTVVAWGSGAGTNMPAGLTNIVAISAGNYVGENYGMAIRSDGTVVTWGDNFSGETNPPAALTNLFSIAGAAAPYHGLALVNDGGPVLLHPPIGLTTYVGRDVALHGEAVGTEPLSYQWRLNGLDIPDATNTSLIISDAQPGDAGDYQLFVSNNISTALSLPAPLTVVSNNALTFLSQPAVAQTNYQGSTVEIGVTVLGNGPVSYQWSFSTNNQIFTAISGATNETLVFDPALATQTGFYRVAVSNQFNFVTSSSSYLRVLFAKSWGYVAVDPPASLNVTNAVAVAVGTALPGHYLVLRSDGKISTWADSFTPYGEINVTALSNSIVTAIAAGVHDSLALKSDGTVYAWGLSNQGQTNPPAGLNGVTAIACGDYYDLALESDGTVVGWGQAYVHLPVNPAATNVVAVAAAQQFGAALRMDGTVVPLSLDQPLPPYDATNVIAIAAGGNHFLALRADGTVIGWGSSPALIPAGISNIVAISAGVNHSVLLRNDGTVLTLGTYAGSPLITAPADLANVIAIGSGGDHDVALFGTRAPAFTVQSWNRAIPLNARTNITLVAKCAGVQPVYYQWQLNGANLPGATNDLLRLTNHPRRNLVPSALFPTALTSSLPATPMASQPANLLKFPRFIRSPMHWTYPRIQRAIHLTLGSRAATPLGSVKPMSRMTAWTLRKAAALARFKKAFCKPRSEPIIRAATPSGGKFPRNNFSIRWSSA
jgi:alpha-tubulin suppressor-like RCC1 family protein